MHQYPIMSLANYCYFAAGFYYVLMLCNHLPLCILCYVFSTAAALRCHK